MSIRMFLMIVMPVLAGAAGAHYACEEYAPNDERVVASQWLIGLLTLAAVAAAVAVTGVVLAMFAKPGGWLTKRRLSPLFPLVVPVATVASIGIVCYVAEQTVAHKTPIAVMHIKVQGREPLKAIDEFATMNDASIDAKWLANAATVIKSFVGDCRAIVNEGDHFGHSPLSRRVADHYGWDRVMTHIQELLAEEDKALGKTWKRRFIVRSSLENHQACLKAKQDLDEEVHALESLVSDRGPAHDYLASATKDLRDFVSQVMVKRPKPAAIETLEQKVNTVGTLTLAGKTSRPPGHQAAWAEALKSVKPAVDCIEERDELHSVMMAMDRLLDSFVVQGNAAKQARPAWWSRWKADSSELISITTYGTHVPTTPAANLEKLRDKHRNEVVEFEKKLDAMRATFLQAATEVDPLKPLEKPAEGTETKDPAWWTPDFIEKLVREKLGLGVWKGIRFAKAHNQEEVLTVIDREWHDLWVNVRPDNSTRSDALKAAQAKAFSVLKVYLREIRDDLQDKVTLVEKENYETQGHFREPFATTDPFRDEANRKQLRELLVGLDFTAHYVDAMPTTANNVTSFPQRVDCTKEAYAMAKRAVVAFTAVCEGGNRPTDDQWSEAGRWWLVLYGFGGGGAAFNPFQAAPELRKPIPVVESGKPTYYIGGLNATDDGSLTSASHPQPKLGPIDGPPQQKREGRLVE